MNKSLPIIAYAALMCGIAYAGDTFPYGTVYEQQAFRAISHDGNIIISDPGEGVVTIFDLRNNRKYEIGDFSETGGMTIGNGNVISRNGIVLVENSQGMEPGYWQNGEITLLNVKSPSAINMCDGISADGSIIVGSRGNEGELMTVPCYWERQEDGTYGEQKTFPYPEKDFLGRTPQYISAICASEDGKIVVGQVQDYAGMRNLPIVYIRDAEGNWSYKEFCWEMANPDHLELPEDPGDGPEQPDPTIYMSKEQKAEYDKAMEEWAANGWIDEEYPNPVNFMDSDKAKEYVKAIEEFNVLAEAYNEKLMAFYGVRNRIIESGKGIVFNNISIVPSASKFYSTLTYTVPSDIPGELPKEICKIVEYDTASVSFNVYETEENLSLANVADDGTISAYVGGFGMLAVQAPSGYVFKPGADTPVPLVDYVSERNPEAGAWMKENMTHMTFVLDPDTQEAVEKEMTETGIAFISGDATAFVSEIINTWNADFNAPDYYGYLFYADKTAGLSQAAPSDREFDVRAAKKGMINVTGIADELAVYTMDGRVVFRAEAVEGIVATGVEPGIYVVKAICGDKKVTKKVIF